MDFKRLARHLFFPRKFPKEAMPAIEQAIERGEPTHSGEIRFAAEDALDGPELLAGESARARAIEVFSELRVWDTEENNGVLIYLLLAEQDIEIVADRGIDARVTQQDWERICRRMEEELRRGGYEKAVVTGIEEASRLLARHYPPRPGDRNELPDAPVRL
jgi:uncharacterized membrane protein